MQNNISYDEYIRTILGYPPINSYNSNEYSNQNMDYIMGSELENCYPEIYKIVYPMITTKCNNITNSVTNEDIENMTDEIYYALEERNEVQININLNNEVKTTTTSNNISRKPEVKVSQNKEEKRETRQINRGLRDLIKILLIRELLNRPGRPHRPRPPMPGPRPPVRPPIRPPYGPGRPPFNREFETSNYDIFEY